MNLTDEQITEGNQLFSEFMNMKTGMTYQLLNSDLNLNVLDRTRTFCYSHELRFHIDWNWLMPVIDKIENLPSTDKGIICVTIDHKSCHIFYDDWGKHETISMGISKISKIDATYKAILDFIKWYNLNFKNN